MMVVGMLGACAPARASVGAAGDQPAGSAKTIVVANGQSARVEDTPLSITLEAIIDDSRCPEGVTCIWAGDVSARIRVDDGTHAPETATLSLNQPNGDTVHGDHRVTLTAVTPFPKADQKIDPRTYRATFRIDTK